MQTLMAIVLLLLNNKSTLTPISETFRLLDTSPIQVQSRDRIVGEDEVSELKIYQRGRLYRLVLTPSPNNPALQKKIQTGATAVEYIITLPPDLASDFVIDRIFEHLNNGLESAWSVISSLFPSQEKTHVKFQILRSAHLDGFLFYEVQITVPDNPEVRVLTGGVDGMILLLTYHPKDEMTTKNEDEWRSIIETLEPKSRAINK